MKPLYLAAAITAFAASLPAQDKPASNYPNNRAPLAAKPYVALPLGAVRANGWLLTMLERQRDGATGHMDAIYPLVMGPRNGWLGGDGDQWERGPYWIDGLLPLAHLLDDDALKAKARPWIEWALASQREDGFFGPAKDYPHENGVQRNNAHDWWPRMVMLKILRQHHSATGDGRVIAFMTKYFRYQLATLPKKPLGHWTFWARFRACDNLSTVYWLYNITGDAFLLELATLLHEQAHDFTAMAERGDLRRIDTIHCVNLAQGIKEPVIYSQQDPSPRYLAAVKQAFSDIRAFHGQPQGMYGGDEALHGSDPTHGVELCSVVELMYSLGQMLEITGDTAFADHLERVAFNALPAQATDDFNHHQYYQQANQIRVTRHRRNFDQDHDGTDILFGTLTGYPCCAANQHQGWPKFVQNLWYATPDNGLAALVYAPSTVRAKVAGGIPVTITEETFYPLHDTVAFNVAFPGRAADAPPVEFPLHLRIPRWAREATLRINGRPFRTLPGGRVEAVNRFWKTGDRLELALPMDIRTDRWHENAISVERGPLVFALRLPENWELKPFADRDRHFGEAAYHVTTDAPWNYAFPDSHRRHPADHFTVAVDEAKLRSPYPWNLENAPITITAKARRVPHWQLYNETAGPLPYSPTYSRAINQSPLEDITLIPYGCTGLRISAFPTIR